MKNIVLVRCLVGAAALSGLSSALAAPKTSATPTVRLSGGVYRISGPYNHKNLSVFLLHAGTKDTADYLTLQEGLKSKLVRIAEKDQEQVSELVITNDSDRPLFLQEGDRIVGGKQDRIISSSLVIPPHSRRVPLPAFCVEHGRWTEGSMQRSFGASGESAIAPLSVRRAAKVANDQSQVWDNVAKEKQMAGSLAGVPARTSSLTEAMESPGFRKIADNSVKTLEGIAAKSRDAVGVAIAINGRIEEVNVYPSHGLLQRLYPRLLRSYALQAAQQSGQALAAKLRPADVTAFLTQRISGKRTDKRIDARNSMRMREMPTAVELQTNYNGQAVHQQYMRK
jgi:hypothetical protein